MTAYSPLADSSEPCVSAILNSPNAVCDLLCAIVLVFCACEPDPLAVVSEPSACEHSPLAVVSDPSAYESSPLAVVRNPSACE